MIKHILTLIWNKKRSNTLMMLEVFIAFLILFFVFSFAIYYYNIYKSPLGFAVEDTFIAHLVIDEDLDSLVQIEIREQLRREIELFPEVKLTSFNSNITPFSGSMWSWGGEDNGFYLESTMYPTDEQFAKAVGLNITEGRWYEKEDLLGKYQPLVINQKLKDTYFPDKPVIDSVIVLFGERKIIGVVDHFKYRDEFEEELPLSFIYRSLADERPMSSLLVKVKPGTQAEFEEKLNNTIAEITNSRDFVIESMEAKCINKSRGTLIPLVMALAICGFLIINIALGLFGVLYYNISKRRGEIGLRRALGATRAEITSQFTLEVFVVATVGMLFAIILAVQFPMMELIDLPAHNFYWSILATFGIISLVVLVCAYSPSRQAAGIHPALALHEE